MQILILKKSKPQREGTSAWFGDKLSQTWGKDLEQEAKNKKAFEAAEEERIRLSNILPRAITGMCVLRKRSLEKKTKKTICFSF